MGKTGQFQKSGECSWGWWGLQEVCTLMGEGCLTRQSDVSNHWSTRPGEPFDFWPEDSHEGTTGALRVLKGGHRKFRQRVTCAEQRRREKLRCHSLLGPNSVGPGGSQRVSKKVPNPRNISKAAGGNPAPARTPRSRV